MELRTSVRMLCLTGSSTDRNGQQHHICITIFPKPDTMHMTYFPLEAQKTFKSRFSLCDDCFASIHLVCKTSQLVELKGQRLLLGPKLEWLHTDFPSLNTPFFPVFFFFLFHPTKWRTSPGIKFPLKHMVKSSQPTLSGCMKSKIWCIHVNPSPSGSLSRCNLTVGLQLLLLLSSGTRLHHAGLREFSVLCNPADVKL